MDVKGADRYNPELLPKLEQAVEKMTADSYSSSSIQALLRMYQLFPERSNPGIVSKLLLKSLMQLPQPEYTNCLHLLPEVLQAEEPFPTIEKMATALLTARFKDFWEAAGGAKELISSTAGFEDAVRKFVVHTVALTYQSVPKGVVAECLNMQGGALDAFCQAQGWAVEGSVVKVPESAGNQHAQKRSAENIPFVVVQGLLVQGP